VSCELRPKKGVRNLEIHIIATTAIRGRPWSTQQARLRPDDVSPGMSAVDEGEMLSR